MQSFLLPKGILDKIDKINKDFFWNKLESTRYCPLLSWDKICKPKSQGGQGIKTAEETNNAFQLKLIWKIVTEPDNCWVKVIKEKYFKDNDFFNIEKTNSSWQFGRLLNLRNKFKKGIRWIIGNGKTTNFWTDLWVSDQSLKMYNNGNTLDRKVADFIDIYGNWDLNALIRILPVHIVDKI